MDYEKMQHLFEQLWGWIYSILRPTHSESAGVPLKNEVVWMVNAHGKALEYMGQGCLHADGALEEILRYTLSVWNSIQPKFPKLRHKVEDLVTSYNKTWENLELPILNPNVCAIWPVCSKEFGQCARFLSMLQKLEIQVQNLQKYAQERPYGIKSASEQMVEASLLEFRQGLTKLQQDLLHGQDAVVLIPQDWIGFCIQKITQLQEQGHVSRAWIKDTLFASFIQETHQLVWKTYLPCITQ